jgi:hypothetical protein
MYSLLFLFQIIYINAFYYYFFVVINIIIHFYICLYIYILYFLALFTVYLISKIDNILKNVNYMTDVYVLLPCDKKMTLSKDRAVWKEKLLE